MLQRNPHILHRERDCLPANTWLNMSTPNTGLKIFTSVVLGSLSSPSHLCLTHLSQGSCREAMLGKPL